MLKEAYKTLREKQQAVPELRKEELHQLSIKRSDQWKLSMAQAAVVIEASESSKELHNKHRRYVKPINEGNIRYLLAPALLTGWKPKESDTTKKNVK